MKKSNLFWISTTASTFCLIAIPAVAQTALGTMGGLRTALGDAGITLGVNDDENLLGNLSGGVKTGATLQGVTTATLDFDMSKSLNLPGGTLHVSALQIHGQPLTPAYLDDLQAANGNEAEDTTRLWELWYDQVFGKVDLKLGQQSIDNEFIVSQYSGLFINTMAGWPLVPSDDLFGGGPAYPLASLGARLRTTQGAFTLLGGVFDDNPGGGTFSDDAQQRDSTGARFNLNTGALFIAEIQYTKPGLPGTYKLGAWDDTGRGNFSPYAVMDQTLWQSTADTSRTVNGFARIMGVPGAKNLITFALNTGLTLAAPLPGRDADTAGLDFGLGIPARGNEELFELTYQAQLTPWLILQPDVQVTLHPGGGIPDPDDANRTLRNSLVAGARAITTF